MENSYVLFMGMSGKIFMFYTYMGMSGTILMFYTYMGMSGNKIIDSILSMEMNMFRIHGPGSGKNMCLSNVILLHTRLYGKVLYM